MLSHIVIPSERSLAKITGVLRHTTKFLRGTRVLLVRDNHLFVAEFLLLLCPLIYDGRLARLRATTKVFQKTMLVV